MFRSQDILFLVFLTIQCFTKMWRHDEYQCMRQDTFLNISLEPQLIDQATWLIDRCNLNDRCKQRQKFYEIFE